MSRPLPSIVFLAAALCVCVLPGAPQQAFGQSVSDLCTNASGDAAIAACTQVIIKDRKAAWAYLNRGIEYRQKGEYDKAIADYNEALRLRPKHAATYNARGNAWRDKDEPDKAMADYTMAIRLDPKLAVAYNNRGIIWELKRQYDKAIADYDAAIKLDPGYANAYLNRADAWDSNGDFDKAIADYGEAIRLNPNSEIAYNNRGATFASRKEYDKAIADYDQAIRLKPDYTRALVNRGVALEAIGEPARAVADFSMALRLDSDNPRARNGLKSATEAMQSAARQPAQQPNALQQPEPRQQAVASAPFGKRVALIIGNANYKYASVLKNPPRDAEVLAATLRNAGFAEVVVKNDMTHGQTLRALRDFARQAESADWAAVYYSGHGIEFGGVNYIIPVDAQLKTDRDIDLEAIDVGKFLTAIEGAKRLRLVILDACRDNPFASQMRRTMATRSLGRGLARIEPEAGTLIVYAAKHGEVALDGEGDNSPFVEALVRRIGQKPSLEIRRLFDVVRDDVMEATRRRQQPFSYGSLSGSEDFFFMR